MSIFKLSTGKKAEANGNFEMGGSSEPIPDGTKVKAAITEAKWDEYEGQRYISLRWDVLDGEFKKRVIFQKIKVYDTDPKKADRQRSMLAAIDANCGGKLMQIDGEPTDLDIIKALANKPMVIRLGVWEINDRKGNWVTACEGNGKATAKKPDATPTPEKKKPEPEPEEIDEDDIPF